jgi:hypothetical protein
MTYFFLCAPLCDRYLRLLITLLIITASYSLATVVVDYDTITNFTIMPVLTRSQTKLLSKTVIQSLISTNQPLDTLEISNNNIPVPSTIDSLIVPSISDVSEFPVTLCHSSLVVPSDLSSSSLVSVSSVDNLKLRNFKISNEHASDCSSSYNFSSDNFLIMESDCKDTNSSRDAKPVLHETSELARLFASLLSQITIQHRDIQDQLKERDCLLNQEFRKVNNDFQKVIEENEAFKENMRNELEDLRQLLSRQSVSSVSSTPIPDHTSSVPPVPSPQAPMPSASSTSVLSIPSNTPSAPDVQAQMMLMLTESFSKLSNVLVDKPESKNEWPKYSGDPKKFRAWYLSIMAQMSLSPWKELYDNVSNTIVPSTSNTLLNEKLYAKLITCLEGQALHDIVSRAHLRANGVSLLHELVEAYKPKHVPEVLAA